MIELTRAGKNTLTIESPVMNAAGILGFGNLYRELIDFEKLGAFVTNPITHQAWRPVTGTRVVPQEAGLLLHTGLPNAGISKVISKYRGVWRTLPAPVIVHIVGTNPEDVQRCMGHVEREESIEAVELGLNDDMSPDDVAWLVRAAVEHTEKPVMVRIPMLDAHALAYAAVDAGADAVVLCAPPRGTARAGDGRLIGGRLYSPLVKPLVLRIVGQLARRVDVPVIGAGGIASPDDARDYLEAGARAVQVDAVTWMNPKQLEIIARDLGGLVLTREVGALLDEWHPGIGKTALGDSDAL